MSPIYRLVIIAASSICSGLTSSAQSEIKPDLSNKNGFQVVNRSIAVTTEQQKIIVHMDARPNNGVAWINDIGFGKGNIEFDVKGKDVLQQSFIGIAFHSMNDSTYEAVYFRPFNFQSSDTLRKSHSVQYVSLPKYDWSVLREKYPGKYENALTKTINPEGWFHVIIAVDENYVTVFVNGDANASLVVKRFSDHAAGKIGFWVGNNSDGDFSGLSIKSN